MKEVCLAPMLRHAYRWALASRYEVAGARRDAMRDPFKLYRCHTTMNRPKICPRGLNLVKAIDEITKMMVERVM